MPMKITHEEARMMALRYMSRHRLTQIQFAEKIGESRKYLNMMLRGKRSPKPIAKYFGYEVPRYFVRIKIEGNEP